MPLPLYRTIYNDLKKRINSRLYASGSILPSEAVLKKEFNVSTITIRRAVQELVLDGLVEKRQGVGSFICSRPHETEVVGLSSFTTDVALGRLRIVRTLLADSMIPAPLEIAVKLGVQPDSLLRQLIRLDITGGEPFSIDRAYIPPDLAVNITCEIAASPLFMHTWQEAAGLQFVKTDYDISVQTAGDYEQTMLKVDASSPLLVTGELVFDSTARPVLWIVSMYDAERCRLNGTVNLVQKKTDHGTIGE